MKIPWSAIFVVLRAVYVAFLKGKVVNLPGGIGPVTLPQQKPTIPRAQYLTLPEGMELPRDERRAPPPRRRSDGLPDAVPPVPLSTSTLGAILFVVFGLPIVGLTVLGVLEWRTLADTTPGNHVTATLRAAWVRAPGAVFLTTLVWMLFLSAVTWGLLAHAFFS